MIKVGVVGCGAHSQTVHLPILNNSQYFNLVAICDSDYRKIEIIGEKYEIAKRYSDYQKMIEDEDIDAIVIVAPEYLHQPMAIAALNYDKHVLCEKPMAKSIVEAETLSAVAESSDKVFALGLNERFRPEVQEIKKFIEDGDLGTINYIKAGRLNNWHDWQLSEWHRARIAAGAFASLGVHLLDLICWFVADDPVVISGWIHKRDDSVEDFAVAQIRFPRSLVNIEVGWSLLMERDFLYCNLFAERGAALIDPFRINRVIRGKMIDATPRLDIHDSYLVSFRIQAKMFADAIMKKIKFPFGWKDGLKMTSITDAFYQSVKTGREVVFN